MERTLSQRRSDYDFGKKNEALVCDKLHTLGIGVKQTHIVNNDRFGEYKPYGPDCFTLIEGSWYPTELKISRVDLRYVELKTHQLQDLCHIGGIYIQITPHRLCVITTNEMIQCTNLTTNSYTGKLVYRFEKPTWIKHNLQLLF